MSTIEINIVDAKDTERITEIFSSSFENYPLMQFCFGDKYKQSMKYLTKLICDEASLVEHLLLGAFLEGKLQGIAFLTLPETSQKEEDVENKPTPSEEEFAAFIGEEALTRMEGYLNLKKANKPQSPHFYINTLGVDPQSQGKGIGSALLSHIHKMSKENNQSTGVALDTQTQQNVDYYQRFGYCLSSVVELETVQNWFMFRPDAE